MKVALPVKIMILDDTSRILKAIGVKYESLYYRKSLC